jgi:predicted RNA-binding Zn-ribbon protein involved in translation (DUF1610 family)
MSPEPDDEPTPSDFSCPLCGSTTLARAIYTMKDGRRIQGAFYRCGGCHFGCTDPSLFISNAGGRSRDG